jgi:long-chain acyl-CoA synthetase
MQSVVRRIQAQATTRPDHIAIVAGNTETTYSELWTQVTTAAAWYRDNGIGPGETILISADSRDRYYAAAYFGAHLAGAIAVPTEFRMPPDQIERRKEFVASEFVVFGERLEEFRQLLASSTSTARFTDDPELPRLADAAEIMFTTGSTGKPKGVTLSHANIAASAELIRNFVGNTADDREVVTVPLTHSFGLGRLRSTILSGGTIVLVPGMTFPQLTVRALRDYAATGLACVPAGMSVLMSKYEDILRDLAGQLKYLEMGSMRFPLAHKISLRKILPNTRLCMHYGLTEASRSAFIEFHSDRDYLESVGKPSPGVEILIKDESGSAVPNGEKGLIHIRAATVMLGYWNDDERTERVLNRDNGWLNTEDLGFQDADGYVHFLGRADDVINAGGVNVLPDDAEIFAKEYDEVEDCGCIGIPDPDGILGEVPLLFVTSDNSGLDLNKLSRFVRDRLGGEVPTVKARLIASLPRSSSGKLLRRELRSMFENEETKSD